MCPAVSTRRSPVNFRPNLNSISTRLIVLGVLLFSFGALGRIFFLTNYMKNDLIEQSSAQLQTIAGYVAEDVDRDVVVRRELLEHMAAKFPLNLLRDGKSLRAWLADRYDINPLFSLGLIVLDPSGKALTDYPAMKGRLDRSYSDREYFRQAMRGEFVIGRPVMGRNSKVPVLPMAIPLKDASGMVHGVLVGISALRSPNFLEALYSTHVGAKGGLVLVSPRDKLFIGASDADIALNPTPPEGSQTLQDKAMKGWRGVGMGVRDGVEELAAVASVPSSGWFVVVRMPASEVFAPLSGLHRFILRNTAYMVPLFFLFIVLLVRYLLRPLRHAAEHADRMTRDEIPLEPLPVVRNDEVGHLTHAFNRVLSKLIESRSELHHIAHHDSMTGLPNRQLLADRMRLALARAHRIKGRVAVLFLDLDGFKPVNDEMGHEAGDAALTEVAARLQNTLRREDTLARVGGDEFVVLLSDLNGNAASTAELVAGKCLDVFQQPFIIRGQPRKLGTSIGISVGSGNCAVDELLVAADRAMYQAKQEGGGKFSWAHECVVCLAAGREASCGLQFPNSPSD